MEKSQMRLVKFVIVVTILVMTLVIAFTTVPPVEEGNRFEGTFWSLVPPLIAIFIAIFTREVFSSLFVGIAIGAFLIADGQLFDTLKNIIGIVSIELPEKGITFAISDCGFLSVLSNGWNAGIIMFLVVIGVIGVLMYVGGGVRAFGTWAEKHVKGPRSAQLFTFGLGIILFVDDYFNCITVGTTMRSLSDKFKVSRAKLAFIVDSTAASMCILVPISSWAAAVSGSLPEGFEGGNGFEIFLETIPYNYYAIFVLIIVFAVIMFGLDVGPMKVHEKNARERGDLFTTPDRPYAGVEEEEFNPNGKFIDLLIPVFVFLIPISILMMIYTGGGFNGVPVIKSFSNCDVSIALASSAVLSLFATIVYYTLRGTVNYSDVMGSLPKGFVNMVSAILILVFAWTLCSITNALDPSSFVERTLSGTALQNLLPAVFMLVAGFIAFSTGTSWGTFGILIPIVCAVFPEGGNLFVVGVSASLAGAVFGDHCSPVSDTTILTSAGAQCEFMNHVTTQAPYGLLAAFMSFLFFLIAGFWQSHFVTLIGVIVLILVLYLVKKMDDKGMGSKIGRLNI